MQHRYNQALALLGLAILLLFCALHVLFLERLYVLAVFLLLLDLLVVYLALSLIKQLAKDDAEKNKFYPAKASNGDIVLGARISRDELSVRTNRPFH
jgi:Ca2+/Na+ antiporter